MPNLPQPPKIMVVRYPADLVELSCGGEKFARNQNETESEFIRRVKQVVLERPDKINPIILVGNF